MWKFMFIGKSLASNKYIEETLRGEELPAPSTLETDAQGTQQCARQLLHVGAQFYALHLQVLLCLASQEGSAVSKRQH